MRSRLAWCARLQWEMHHLGLPLAVLKLEIDVNPEFQPDDAHALDSVLTVHHRQSWRQISWCLCAFVVKVLQYPLGQ
jgi:hypothetical protein